MGQASSRAYSSEVPGIPIRLESIGVPGILSRQGFEKRAASKSEAPRRIEIDPRSPVCLRDRHDDFSAVGCAAVDGDRPPMVLHHPLGNRETEADAVAFARLGVVALEKSLTHAGKIFLGDPGTGISHTEMQPGFLTAQNPMNLELDVPSRTVELDAVLDDRAQGGFRAFRFAADRLEPTGYEDVDCDLSFLGEIPQRCDGLAKEILSASGS